MMRPHRIGPWRRGFQWATTLSVLLLPFLRARGESLLRIDLPTRSLLAFGFALRLEELFLFLLLCVTAVLVLLLLTLVFGRVWCGWACPQTSLSDLLEAFARRIGARVGGGRISARPWQGALVHAFSAALGALVAANLVWYFISPYEFFPLLLRGELPRPAVTALGIVAVVVYLDLAFVRRSFCRTVCPYGRIQTALVDSGTLALQLTPSRAALCLDCQACLRACPTGSDIRKGVQVECINCGRCLDACRSVMSRRGGEGLIAYAFGAEGRGPGALLSARLALVAAAALAVGTAFAFAASARNPVAFTVRRGSADARSLRGGAAAVFFTGYAANRGRTPLALALTAHGPAGNAVEVRGPAGPILLAPGQRQKVDFVLIVPNPVSAGSFPVLLRLAAPGGAPAAEAQVAVTGSARP